MLILLKKIYKLFKIKPTDSCCRRLRLFSGNCCQLYSAASFLQENVAVYAGLPPGRNGWCHKKCPIRQVQLPKKYNF